MCYGMPLDGYGISAMFVRDIYEDRLRQVYRFLTPLDTFELCGSVFAECRYVDPLRGDVFPPPLDTVMVVWLLVYVVLIFVSY